MLSKLNRKCAHIVLRGAGYPARVVGIRRSVPASAEQARVKLGAWRARNKKLFVRVTEC